MIKIEFNKKLELIFGLIYCVDKDYNIYDFPFCKETLPNYCKEFYKLYKDNISNELIEYIKKEGLGTYDTTAKIALSLNNNYEIEENNEIKQLISNIPSFNKKTLNKLLKEFVAKSNYDEFYKKSVETIISSSGSINSSSSNINSIAEL